MKRIALSILAVCASMGIQSCMNESHVSSTNSSSTATAEDPGQVSLSVDLGPVGVLARAAQMTPARLEISFVSSMSDTILDTIRIVGRSSVAKAYTLPSQRSWRLLVSGYDQRDSLLYSGDTTFNVLAKKTTRLDLSLDSRHSTVRVNFPIRDSLTRFVFSVDGVVWGDSSVAKQSRVGDTIKIDHDYLSASKTGDLHRFSIKVYGQPWDVDTLLYALDTSLAVVSGESTGRILVLKWVGPNNPPAGQASLEISLGAVGRLDIQVRYENFLFTDSRDGKLYRAVAIGTQTWMAQNLNYAGKGVCNANLTSNCDRFGRLYTLAEVLDGDEPGVRVQGICPAGWRIPSNDDWSELEGFVLSRSNGDSTKASEALISRNGWNDATGTDEFGFGLLPGGSRADNGTFFGLGTESPIWTSTPFQNGRGSVFVLSTPSLRWLNTNSGDTWSFGLRCVMD